MNNTEKTTLITSVLALIISASAIVATLYGVHTSIDNTNHLYQVQQLDEQKNIAKAIDIDIESIYNSQGFQDYYMTYNNSHYNYSEGYNKHYSDSGDLMPLISSPMYNMNSSLYFVFDHDISQFNYTLSSELYNLYNNLFIAQDDWANAMKIQNQQIPLDDSMIIAYQGYLFDLGDRVVKSYNEIPTIHQQLKSIYDSNDSYSI